MSKQIVKHKISTDPETTTVRHLRNGEVKHFGIVGGTPFVWVETMDGHRTMRRNYRTFGTAEDVPDHFTYIATAQDPQTDVSIHLYREED